MKRFALAIILLTAVGVAVFLALNRPGAEASPGVILTVDTTVDWIGPNSHLSLSEGIMLASGELSVGDLTEAECDQVSGAIWRLYPILGCFSSDPPGPASADTVVFDTSVFPPGSPATITFPMFSHGLAGLFSEHDTVDGSSAGVRVDGGGVGWDCFRIYSNHNVIKGLEIYNCGRGVLIEGGHGNIIGGSSSGEGNVISGNDYCGVRIEGGSGNVVKGNYIGTNADGTAAIPNSDGVYISGGGQNIIGGSTAGDRNVISGNDFSGVSINGANGNTVEGNYIGTNADGDAALPNMYGVGIYGGAQNIIGGSTSGEGNVISGNDDYGVRIGGGANGNTVKGNYIGTNADGTAAIPNSDGVSIGGGAQNISVGGTAAGEGNTIAFNHLHGLRVIGADAIGNAIRGNSIHSNGGKGIENDTGGNEELPPPTVESVGSIFGTACPDCTIDVYSDDEDEGRVYEGSTTAEGDGNWSFSGTPEGPNITATATDSDGNTSEFSEPLVPPWPTPTSAPTPSPTPTGTPTATPTGTPTPGATRTLHWGPGWHNATWSGASTPEEAFACAAGNYAAAYRLVSGGWERHFPDRPGLSNMADLEQHNAFLILITGDLTCEMAVADPPGSERTLDWGVGWQNDGWTGADGTMPQDAFACAAGSFAAAYRLVGGGWERYFPDRPEISNMGPLNLYDPFLILVTAPVSCTMAVAP